MRFLRAALSPFHRSRGRLLLAALLLVVALGLLATGLGGLMFAKESDPPTTTEGTLALPRNGLDTPTATPIPTQPPSSAPIARMIIEKIGIDAPVITMGLDEEHVPRVPDNPNDVVWYDFSSPPGWGSNAVFSGHVDWTVNGAAVAGVFWGLRNLAVGDIIKVRLADNTEYQYTVSANVALPFDDPKALEAMGATPTEMLTIITCGGTWVPIPGDPLGGNYTHRQIVQAQQVYEEPTSPMSERARLEREVP